MAILLAFLIIRKQEKLPEQFFRHRRRRPGQSPEMAGLKHLRAPQGAQVAAALTT